VLRAATVTERPGPSRLLTQVAEAESPTQLEGWTGVSTGRIVGAVKAFVEVDTRHTGVGQTIESINKDIALETLLSSGSPRTTGILNTAIANETNVYTAAELMRALSMFPVRSLPPRVTNALRDDPASQRI
jgi:hypothetical protein